MKYPRTFHMPFSPGASSDDKIIDSMDSFVGRDVVITEKMDGSNSCMDTKNVFARTHTVPARHPSFNRLKQVHQQILFQLKENEQIFGENCFAVHSIVYDLLPSFYFMFGILNKDTATWASWSEVKEKAKELGLHTAPEIGVYNFKNLKELQKTVEDLCKQKSIFGGSREGVVLRITDSFSNDQFEHCVVKWVREDHVTTDDHWSLQAIVPQKIKKD